MLLDLLMELYRQIEEAGLENEWCVYTEQDGGLIPIGAKRNKLTINARCEYLISFDDDDWPEPDYVKVIDNELKTKPDAVGYEVLNPSKSIKTFHLHMTGLRRYDKIDKVDKPYKIVHPLSLGS